MINSLQWIASKAINYHASSLLKLPVSHVLYMCVWGKVSLNFVFKTALRAWKGNKFRHFSIVIKYCSFRYEDVFLALSHASTSTIYFSIEMMIIICLFPCLSIISPWKVNSCVFVEARRTLNQDIFSNNSKLML